MNTLDEFKNIIQKINLEEGLNETNIPFVKIFKSLSSGEVLHTVYEPSLFIILQGSKTVMVRDKVFEYDSSSYFISSTLLAVSGKVIQASQKEPFISIQIVFSQEQIFQALGEFSMNLNKVDTPNFSVSTYTLDDNLKGSILRLVKLNETPKDVEVLSKIYLKEILYRLLVSNQNIKLQQLAFIESNSYKISKAITFINQNLHETFLMDDIAKLVNMSISSFHKHFKTITGVSPLQYAKKLKLLEAKRLMTLENMDIEGAAFYVGYQNSEYSSYFGMSPGKSM